MRALVTGATGFIGSRLARGLDDGAHEVRCLVRDAARTEPLRRAGLEIHQGDALDATSLRGAGRGVDVAYYLIHSMGRGGDGDFAERERRAARHFAEMCLQEGVGRVVYLGGLGDRPESEHLRSRQQTAEILAGHGPPLTYFRAAMVVGAGSESFRILRHLVARLPVMVAPRWLRTETQPIGVDDVLRYLIQAPRTPESAGRAVEIGGPQVLSYAEMLGITARVLGKRPRPMLPVPVLTPGLSALWIGLVTPVDTGVARPLIAGLSTRTVVTDASGARAFAIEPEPFEAAMTRALEEERTSA